jgi:hypothetical protein
MCAAKLTLKYFANATQEQLVRYISIEKINKLLRDK